MKNNSSEITLMHSIKTKMILPILMFSVCICLLLIFIVTPWQYRQTFSLMELNSKSLANAVSFGVGVGLEFDDRQSVDEALEGIKKLENLSYILVQDNSNNLFYDYKKENTKGLDFQNKTLGGGSFVENNIFSFTSPIIGRMSESRIGTLVMGLDIENLLALKRSNQKRGLFISLAILSIGLICSLFIAINISRPIDKIVEMIQKINNGNLSYRLNMKRMDEIGILSSALDDFASNMEEEILTAFKKLADGDFTFESSGLIKNPLAQTNANLYKVINQINTAASQFNSSADQINNASQSLSQGASEQASALEEISSSLNELGKQTSGNAENANKANLLAGKAKKTAEKGNRQMQEMVFAMNEITDASNNISKIIKVIDEIAFQTNLLALNAAVEAARAGKFGKGFAVVAEEVRSLAARSAKAARETAQLIESSSEKTSNGAELANITSEALAEIVNDVNDTAGLIDGIAEASTQQAEGIAQVNKGLSQIDQVTQQNTANAEESAAAAEELLVQSNELKAMLTMFKLKKSGAKPAVNERNASDYIITETKKEYADQQQIGYTMRRRIDPNQIINLDDTEFGKY